MESVSREKIQSSYAEGQEDSMQETLVLAVDVTAHAAFHLPPLQAHVQTQCVDI